MNKLNELQKWKNLHQQSEKIIANKDKEIRELEEAYKNREGRNVKLINSSVFCY